MNPLKIFGKQLLLIFISFNIQTSFLYAQPGLPILDVEHKTTVMQDLEVIQGFKRNKQYFYLPDQLQLKKNKAGNYMLSLLKYKGENNSGTILNAQFTFEPATVKSTKIQDVLDKNLTESYYAGAYPFYHHEKFYGQFENIDLIIELVDGSEQKEIGRHKAALNNTGLVISARLPDDQSDLIWKTLTQNTRKSIHFKIQVEVKTIQREDDISIAFTPQLLKAYLMNTLDSTSLNKTDFESTIKSIINEDDGELLQIKGNIEAYPEEELTNMIAERVREILFEPCEENSMANHSKSYSSSKTTKRIIINGEVVVDETEQEAVKDNSELNNTLHFKKNYDFPDTVNEYRIGKKQIIEQSYPLTFDLSDFYHRHQGNFKGN